MDYMKELITENAVDLFRYKGVISIIGKDERFLF